MELEKLFLKAGIEYPESRRILYGKLQTKNGIVDAVLSYKNSILPVEIKDYRSKPVSKTEIMQLIRYLIALKCKRGLLISYGGKKKEFNLEAKKVIVIPVKELEKYLGLWSNLVRTRYASPKNRLQPYGALIPR